MSDIPKSAQRRVDFSTGPDTGTVRTCKCAERRARIDALEEALNVARDAVDELIEYADAHKVEFPHDRCGCGDGNQKCWEMWNVVKVDAQHAHAVLHGPDTEEAG